MMWKAKKHQVVGFIVAAVAVHMGDLSLLDAAVAVKRETDATAPSANAKDLCLYITGNCGSVSHCIDLPVASS